MAFQDVWLLPIKLRRAFFSQLARNSLQQDSVTSIRLFVNFIDVQPPVQTDQQPPAGLHSGLPHHSAFAENA